MLVLYLLTPATSVFWRTPFESCTHLPMDFALRRTMKALLRELGLRRSLLLVLRTLRFRLEAWQLWLLRP